MNQEELLKIFYKYGFYSFKKEPFLYVGKLGIGISYTFKDENYGKLTRLFLPENIEDAENFLAKYCWYKMNEQKYDIKIILDNYKKETPSVKFMYQEQELTLDDMKKFKTENKDPQLEKEERNYKKKIKRTIRILVNIIESKLKVQNDTYHSLVEFTNSLIEKQNELNRKLSKMTKISYEELKKVEETPMVIDLQDFKNQINSLENKEEIKENIKSLITYLKSLELDEGLIKNKYELIKLPLEINVIKEKINLLDSLNQKKKGLFNKKDKLETLLKEIEKKSELKNIVNYEQYKENEEKRIEEKYSVVKELDIRTIGDYFIEFDNLKIEEPMIIEENESTTSITTEEIIEDLEMSFQNRPKEEQNVITELEYISKNVILEDKKNLEYFISLINNPDNIMMKVKYFKNIDTSTTERCKISIEKELKKLETLKKDILKGDIKVYLKGPQDLSKESIIRASNNRLLAPILKKENNKVTYLIDLKRNTNVIYSPNEITMDMNQDDILILKTETPFFFVDLQKNVLQDKISDIIEIEELKEEKESNGKITIVKDLKKLKTSLYKKVIIERN